jgi:hypothetical protein
VDHRALEVLLGDGALEFVGGGDRIDRRQRAERGEALGIGRAEIRQPIVDPRGDLRGVGTGEPLRRGRAVRDHLHVDTGIVHFLDPQFAHVEQTVGDGSIALDGRGVRGKFLVPIVLFDGDDRTVRLERHCFPRLKI